MQNSVNSTREQGQIWRVTARHEPSHGFAGKCLIISILSAALLIAPHGASAFRAFNGMDVNQINDNVFEVIQRVDNPAGHTYWCAAAQFAEAELRAKSTSELYIARGLGPAETVKRSSAVQFTLDPSAAGITPAPLGDDLNNIVVGEHMQIGLARTYCNN